MGADACLTMVSPKWGPLELLASTPCLGTGWPSSGGVERSCPAAPLKRTNKNGIRIGTQRGQVGAAFNGSKPNASSKRILVVDDDAAIRRLLTELLRAEYVVAVARTMRQLRLA